MRRRTTVLVGGAVAVALALGGARRRRLRRVSVRRALHRFHIGSSGDRRSGARRSGWCDGDRDRRARGAGSRSTRRRRSPHPARLRVPAPLARDRGSVVSAALGGGSQEGIAHAAPGAERGSRARLARPHQARVSEGSRVRSRGAAAVAGVGAALRGHRGCARRAGTVRAGVRGLPADGRAAAGSLLVRPGRVRA